MDYVKGMIVAYFVDSIVSLNHGINFSESVWYGCCLFRGLNCVPESCHEVF